METRILITTVAVLACTGLYAAGQEAGLPWDFETLKTSPDFRWVEEGAPIRELIYESGVSYRGVATEVFAFYADPVTVGREEAEAPFPGIVLIHGGGGTAFSEWVWLWANRGYAAIAMDLSGRRPASPDFGPETGELLRDNGFDREKRTRLAQGGPEHGHGEKFASIGGAVEDDWPFHTVANVMRAHSLLRSFPDVDADRTAGTGISWGGYSTCLVASNDDRFSAAVPVYGCGFLHEGESVQKPMIDTLEPEERRSEWIRRWDPSSHLGRCRVPILFVNGTHDKHYPLDSYRKSFDLVPGEKAMRIEPRMPHGHRAGWAPEEIGIFVDSHCRGGAPLPVLGEPEVEGERIRVAVTSETDLVEAALHFTVETGLRTEREWQERPLTIGENVLEGAAPAAEANTWFVTARDERGALVSTPVVVR